MSLTQSLFEFCQQNNYMKRHTDSTDRNCCLDVFIELKAYMYVLIDSRDKQTFITAAAAKTDSRRASPCYCSHDYWNIVKLIS